MKFRIAVVFLALLALGSVARAECLTCVPLGVGRDGTCQPTTSGRCTYTCCLWDLGTYCVTNENVYNCFQDDPFVIPSSYFTTALPLQTRGSALRLMMGKGKPVQQKCAGSLMRKVDRS
ncbi:MAG TPA: hypothetical protein VGR02_01455 [Thermoanaerobaculia bacterium]|nr:hypothetical protein [Thermoanaerobaculia bacterium]